MGISSVSCFGCLRTKDKLDGSYSPVHLRVLSFSGLLCSGLHICGQHVLLLLGCSVESNAVRIEQLPSAEGIILPVACLWFFEQCK